MLKRFCCGLVLMFLPAGLQAAKIKVHFVDQQNKPLPNVESKLVNTESKEEQALKANKKGELEFEKVAAGTYQIQAHKSGYLFSKAIPVKVADKDVEVNVRLVDHDAFSKIEKAGNDAFGQKDFKAALERYNEALTLLPDNATTLSNISKSYAMLKEWDKALDVARKASVSDPNEFGNFEKQVLSWAKFEEGQAYLAKQEFPKAAAALKESADADPNNPETYYGLALAYGHQQIYDEALKYIHLALKLKPDDQDMLNVEKILNTNAGIK